jgi:hypothetical protein
MKLRFGFLKRQIRMINLTVKIIKKELRRGHKSIKLENGKGHFKTVSNEIQWIIREF